MNDRGVMLCVGWMCSAGVLAALGKANMGTLYAGIIMVLVAFLFFGERK